MEIKNKKITGFSKKYKYYAGMILLGSMLLTPQQAAFADEVEKDVRQEENSEKTDLEKYFTCDIPMDENYQVTKESDIYKIISFYEGKPEAENGNYQIKTDPDCNLVVAGGLTLKYQQEFLDYLSQNYGSTNDEILKNVTDLINQGNAVYIPDYIVNDGFISEIQNCRNKAISAAKEFNINLSEGQINVLTELNFRYGIEQSRRFFECLSKGYNIEDFTVTLNRTNGTVNENPFKGIDGDVTVEKLTSTDIANEVANSGAFQYAGDRRRGLFRQIGIIYNTSPIILNDAGICRYFENAEVRETDLINYLVNVIGVQKNDYSVNYGESESYQVSTEDLQNTEIQTDTPSLETETMEMSTEDVNTVIPSNEDINTEISSEQSGTEVPSKEEESQVQTEINDEIESKEDLGNISQGFESTMTDIEDESEISKENLGDSLESSESTMTDIEDESEISKEDLSNILESFESTMTNSEDVTNVSDTYESDDINPSSEEKESEHEKNETALISTDNKIKIPIISSIITALAVLAYKIKNRKSKTSKDNSNLYEEKSSKTKQNEFRKRIREDAENERLKEQKEKNDYILICKLNRIVKIIENNRKNAIEIVKMPQDEKNKFQRYQNVIILRHENNKIIDEKSEKNYKEAKRNKFILENEDMTRYVLRLSKKSRNKLKKELNKEMLKYRRKHKNKRIENRYINKNNSLSNDELLSG